MINSIYYTDQFAWNHTKSCGSSGLCHGQGFSYHFHKGGRGFASSVHKIGSWMKRGAYTRFFEIMKNQAFPVFGVKSRMGEVCGCMARATLCWFFNFEIFWNFHFWALWTCHHTLLKVFFYLRNDYFWNDLKWFETIWNDLKRF